MRKIISKEDEGKKRRRNQFIIGGVLILVMLASSLGYAFTREQTASNEKIIYNGFEFTKQSGFWSTNINSYQFFFAYNPKETPKINSILNSLESYVGKPLYIYSESSEAATEIYRNLFYQNQIVERVQDACLNGEKCENNAPIKTCENNFIIIKESVNNRIMQNKSCVFVEGNMGNLTQLSDEFLFNIAGITQ